MTTSEDQLYLSFCENQARILEVVPPEFHVAIRSKAWDDGHAYGYDEVILHTQILVDLLQEPVEVFAARLRGERAQLKGSH